MTYSVAGTHARAMEEQSEPPIEGPIDVEGCSVSQRVHRVRNPRESNPSLGLSA